MKTKIANKIKHTIFLSTKHKFALAFIPSITVSEVMHKKLTTEPYSKIAQITVPIAVFLRLFPSGSERSSAILANESGALGSFLRSPDHRVNRAAGDI